MVDACIIAPCDIPSGPTLSMYGIPCKFICRWQEARISELSQYIQYPYEGLGMQNFQEEPLSTHQPIVM